MNPRSLHARVRRLEQLAADASVSQAEQLRLAREARSHMSPTEREAHRAKLFAHALSSEPGSIAHRLATRRALRLAAAE